MVQPAPYPRDKFPPTDIRHFVVRKVLDISEAIVRGRLAAKRWEVYAYRARMVAGALLNTSGIAGIVAIFGLPDYAVWGYGVAIGSNVLNIAVELYNKFGVEATATKALNARDAFNGRYTNMAAVLRRQDPNDSLDELSKDSDTLLVTFDNVLPEQTPDVIEQARLMACDLVDQYENRWLQKPVPEGGRVR
jgi:hypothetical protein